MSVMLSVFKSAADSADAAYRKALASGIGEDAAREECKAEFYCGLFRFFMNPYLSKWNATGGMS